MSTLATDAERMDAANEHTADKHTTDATAKDLPNAAEPTDSAPSSASKARKPKAAKSRQDNAGSASTAMVDEPLSAAIQTWFAHYDERFPIIGELFAASPNDDAFHSSSIVKVEKRPEMATFHWGAGGGMLGPMPDMNKGDGE